MHASSKLRSIRTLKKRDQPSGHTNMHAALRREMHLQHQHTTASAMDEDSRSARAMMTTLRRNSSSDIEIPQFMIPSSASSLMNSHYSLSPATPHTVSRRPVQAIQ